MRLMQLKSEGHRWGFIGSMIPMELARKTWPDRYAAIRAAEQVGYVVLANGSCISDTEPAVRTKSPDGLGSYRTPECLHEGCLAASEGAVTGSGNALLAEGARKEIGGAATSVENLDSRSS